MTTHQHAASTGPGKTLEIRSSPHILSGHGVDTIMFNVVLALLPVTAFAIYVFGLTALLSVTTALASCLLAEAWVSRRSASGKLSTLGDFSITITALLYALTLPPGLPLWMVAVGGFVAVFLGKALFGGLGQNPFNPALVGRAFLQAAFPAAMTQWVPAFAANRFTTLPSSVLAWPFARPVYEPFDAAVTGVDGWTGATPLARWKFEGLGTDAGDLALGLVGGSLGETSTLLIVLGGLYLVARNMMSWQIPVAVLGSVALLSALLHLASPERYASPLFMLFSGGLMLGAVFMATDMVASPMTPEGCVAYGALIGALVVVIRSWGGMPEGVMYAILLGNAVSPHLDNYFRPTVYGTRGTTGGGS